MQRRHSLYWFEGARFPIFSSAIAVIFLLGPPAAASDDCGDLDYAGECHGDVARWCENGRLYEVDCEATGDECDWDSDEGWFGCVPEGDDEESCGNGLDWTGTCDGDRVLWCDSGEVATLTCKEGTECAWHTDGYFDCLPIGQSGGAAAPNDSLPDPDGGAEPGGEGAGFEPGAGGEPADEEDDAAAWNKGAESEEGGTNPIEALPSPPAGSSTQTPDPNGEVATPARDDASDPAEGCNASPTSPLAPGVLVLLALLALALLRRRPARAPIRFRSR